MRPRLEPSKSGSFRNSSTFESCLQRTKVLWGSVFWGKWSGYIKKFAAWIGLEPCQKGAPNDQHFRGTWHFSYSQVGCAKERFSHWACHWFHIVTVPICLKMQKIIMYIYIFTEFKSAMFNLSLGLFVWSYQPALKQASLFRMHLNHPNNHKGKGWEFLQRHGDQHLSRNTGQISGLNLSCFHVGCRLGRGRGPSKVLGECWKCISSRGGPSE